MFKFTDLTDSDKRTVLYIVQKERQEWMDRREMVAKRWREYDRGVWDWYHKGDGRSWEDGGRGYAYPRCIHGVYILTDYDIPCSACEAGDWDDWNYLEMIRWSVVRWQRAKVEGAKRRAALMGLVEAGYPPFDIPSEMNAWAIAPVMDLIGA